MFDVGFSAGQDASELAAWLKSFCEDKGKPPKLLSFTFHAADEDADDVCRFMKECVDMPELASILSMIRLELIFCGEMSDALMSETHDRIMSQRF